MILTVIFVLSVLLIGEILLGHKSKETFFDIGLSIIAAVATRFVYRITPSTFIESALPSIIISLGTLIGVFFLFKPLLFKNFLPHDLQEMTIPMVGLREFGFTILITFIDGFIDITFKVKNGETSVEKISKDFKEHMEKTREENME